MKEGSNAYVSLQFPLWRKLGLGLGLELWMRRLEGSIGSWRLREEEGELYLLVDHCLLFERLLRCLLCGLDGLR